MNIHILVFNTNITVYCGHHEGVSLKKYVLSCKKKDRGLRGHFIRPAFTPTKAPVFAASDVTKLSDKEYSVLEYVSVFVAKASGGPKCDTEK